MSDDDHTVIPFPDRRTYPGETAEPVRVVEAQVIDSDRPAAGGRRERPRQPVLPGWLISRAQFTATVRWAAGYAAHVLAFHTVRVPLYAGRLIGGAPRGTGRAFAAWFRWAFDVEGSPLRRQTVERLDPDTYITLSRQRNVRVKGRLRFSGTVAVVALLMLLVGLVASRPALELALLGAVGVLGWYGRRADRPIVTPATLTQAVRKLTPDVVVRAFVSAGLCKEDDPVTFAQPIQRDGKGWLAVVDLPYGRHYGQAAAKRDAISSGLDVSPVTVFCDPSPASARRMMLWVSDVDVFAQKPVVSPLIKVDAFDVWQPIPFGLDARDRPVLLPLVWSSLLVGAIPRMGKTSSARIPAAAAALDPHTRLLVWDGKGGVY